MQASRNGPLALCALGILHQRMVADLLAQIVLVPGVPVDRADHAERVARRRQEDRNRAGLDQRALVQRLVIVAIEEHEVAAPQHRVGDDLVRGAGAVQDEVGLVGAEHLRGVPLRSTAAPSWISRSPRSTSALHRSLRKICSPKCLKKSWPAGDLR